MDSSKSNKIKPKKDAYTEQKPNYISISECC